MKLRLILYWLVEQQEVFKKCKSNPWESQHRLVITDINKKKLKKVVKSEKTVRRRVWKLKEMMKP